MHLSIKVMLPDSFIESWVYSSALSAVDTCEEWARNLNLDSTKSAHLNAAKGELLQISRSQVSAESLHSTETLLNRCKVG